MSSQGITAPVAHGNARQRFALWSWPDYRALAPSTFMGFGRSRPGHVAAIQVSAYAKTPLVLLHEYRSLNLRIGYPDARLSACR